MSVDRMPGPGTRQIRLMELEAKYSHLQPLPPQLPSPPYGTPGEAASSATCYAISDEFVRFYGACAEGDLDRVRSFVQTLQTSAADICYALEEACQNLRPDVVRFLLVQPGAQLHYRCFRRPIVYPQDDIAKGFDGSRSRTVSQSIFTTTDGSSRLLDLLKVFLDDGWHPNQLLGPLQKGRSRPVSLPRQEVVLHYPRCILDLDVLRLLLDAGADPTIARDICADIEFDFADQPVQRMSGHILQMAVNLGAEKAVELLVSHGASPSCGVPLHSLVRRRPDEAMMKAVDETYLENLWQETPELRYFDFTKRLSMARQLLHLGEDINRTGNVYWIMGMYCGIPTREVKATALLHAKQSMDWPLVKWLLEYGADPNAGPKPYCPGLEWSIGASQADIEEKYQQVAQKVEQDERGSSEPL